MKQLLQALENLLAGMWTVLGQMAPYLLLGFLMAGVLSVWLSPAWVARHLHGRRRWAPVKAALFGVPLPLCSCGVIPVAAALRRHGAGRGATAAFLMSTPQTGVDSILATYGLLGPLIAVFRPVAAFLSGALTGVLVDRLAPETPAPGANESESEIIEETRDPRRPAWLRALRHGFVTLPGDIHRAVLIGLAISAALGALFPPGFLREHIGQGWGSILLMLALGVPLYVCSTGSIPIAVGLIHAGVSPGAALVFLITGPATNAAALATFVKLLGLRATAIYLLTLVATAVASALLLDRALIPALPEGVCHAEMTDLGLWGHLMAAALLAVLLAPIVRRRLKTRRAARPTCGADALEFSVRGMSCAKCAERIEQAVGAMPGVSRVTVNLRAASARIEGCSLDRDRLLDTIRRLGYEAH